MKFDTFKRVLKKTPVNVINNKESILCVDYDFAIASSDSFIKMVDSQESLLDLTPTVILQANKKTKVKFPTYSIDEPFHLLDINKYLFNKFDLAKEIFIKQSSIKNIFLSQSSKQEFIALLVIDGLSYVDCLHWDNVKPCLVDTVTTTKNGFRNIICNNRTIAHDLFHKNFMSFNGFSYWEKDQKNELTDEIFAGFHSVVKFEAYSEVINRLSSPVRTKSFYQIVMQGLDGIAHNNRDEPLIKPIVDNIWSRIEQTVERFVKSKLKGIIYVTSDHGILWKHRSNLQKIASHTSVSHYHQRYYDSKVLSNQCKNFSIAGKNLSSLEYPYILRNMRPNEWGVHGGVSLEESIVPFLTIQVN